MMKVKIAILFLCTLFSCATSKKIRKEEGEKDVLVGVIDRSELKKTPYNDWFVKRYTNFFLNEDIKHQLKENKERIKIKVFLGLWCGDSKREIPVLYKILDEINFNNKYIELIAVDRKKKAKGLEKKYNIKRVPTFIFYKDKKEIGRFIEYPVKTLEKDILNIMSGKKYKHFYQK